MKRARLGDDEAVASVAKAQHNPPGHYVAKWELVSV